MGTARPSFMKGLQDEYDLMGAKDPEHEEDMKALGGMVHGGQGSNFLFKPILSNCMSDFDIASWIRYCEFVCLE